MVTWTLISVNFGTQLDQLEDAERRRDMVGDQHPVLLIQSKVRFFPDFTFIPQAFDRSLRSSGLRHRISVETSSMSPDSVVDNHVRSPTHDTQPYVSTMVCGPLLSCLAFHDPSRHYHS